MGASVSVISKTKTYSKYFVVADITFDDSYPTGGEAITPNQLKLESGIDFLMAAPAAGYMFEFDHANKKLKAYTPVKSQAAHTHAENTAEEYTKDAVTAAGGAISAAPAAEVANATDLHTVATRVIAVGY
jgi:hypothetical protein